MDPAIKKVAIVIALALIVVIGVELGKSSLEKIIAPTPVAFSLPLAAVLVAAVALKLGLYFFNRHLGKKISSTALLATAADMLAANESRNRKTLLFIL